MKNNKVLIAIITFQPNIDDLRKVLDNLCNQAENVLIYDNASENADDIQQLANGYDKVRLFRNKENIGLPVNYNRAVKYAYKKGLEWVMLLDQDSCVPDDIVSTLLEYADDEKTAIVCPRYFDVNLYSDKEIASYKPEEKFSYVEECISSCSMNRVSTLIELGGFDEQMFIDQVDFDYCKNARLHGYNIIMVNDCIIKHAIGNSRWVNMFGRKEIVYNHSPFRKYYFFRNKVYFIKKYHLTPIKNRKYFLNFFKFYLLLFYEKENKWKKYRAAMKGFRAGFKMKPKYRYINIKVDK